MPISGYYPATKYSYSYPSYSYSYPSYGYSYPYYGYSRAYYPQAYYGVAGQVPVTVRAA